MDWATLILAVIDAIKECLENRDRNQVEAGLHRPGMREAWALRKILRRDEGLRGRALHAAVRDGMDYLADMDSAEIGALCDEAEKG
ncbi:hypothetical protein HQ590_13805 [bacterium]|nr:hypothetical protein [bacterium]